MNTTEIGILGPLRSKIEGNEVVLPGTKLRSIMAILAFRAGETVISDVLVEELGLDQSSTNAANTLQARVSRLRRWLCMHNSAPNLLETTNSGYRLNLDRTQVDAHLFVDQAEKAPESAGCRSHSRRVGRLRLGSRRRRQVAGIRPICQLMSELLARARLLATSTRPAVFASTSVRLTYATASTTKST
jgi:DNA-binding winged helix-turn-helix (wHTH) protein